MIKEKQGTLNKEGVLINELDSLKYTLNNGPEFQQDIPTLDEQYIPPQLELDSDLSAQCDLFRDSDGIIHDPDIDIPILTDACEEPDANAVLPGSESSSFEVSNTEAANSELSNSEPSSTTAPVDIAQLSDETDSSVMELEHVLDELVAEQLPKLEQQLREKLRSGLTACSEAKDAKAHDVENSLELNSSELTSAEAKSSEEKNT